MKKVIVLITTCLLVLSLVACSNVSKNDISSSSEQTNETSSTETVNKPSSEVTQMPHNSISEVTTKPQNPSVTTMTSKEEISKPSEDEVNEIVVYFSWSGNTENVAKEIASQTDAAIFEIIPETPYSEDYDTVVNLAKKEQSDNVRPEIAKEIENFEEYDVFYIGYPNWWGDMPMILYTFFESYDFSGKTIAPFCTSGGSGLSNTVADIKSLENEATVTKGLHIGSGASDNPTEAVTNWLQAME